MNTIIVNDGCTFIREFVEKKLTDMFIDDFIFDKFKVIFEGVFKATVQLENGTKRGRATIIGLEEKPEDRREKHTFSWDFVNHEYSEDDMMYDKCRCFDYDRETYIKNLIADDYQIKAECSVIVWFCYYIMTAKREKIVKKSAPKKQSDHKAQNKNQRDKKIFLFNEIIEYVNENRPNRTNQSKSSMKCPCWGVRGHYRHYKSGKVVFVKEYKKGKERANKEPKSKTYTI